MGIIFYHIKHFSIGGEFMKVAIITTGYLPVPPCNGGAVETLCYSLMKENLINKKINITTYSIYDSKLTDYDLSQSKIVKVSFVYKLLDILLYFFAKYILRKKKVMSYRYIFRRLRFLKKTSKDISKNDYDIILLENHYTEFMIFKWFKNFEKYKGKIYYHVHNIPSGTYGCEEYIKNAKFLCVSNYIKKYTLEYFNLNASQLKVLRNAVDSKLFNNDLTNINVNQLKNKLNIDSNKKIILFTGRLSKEKGIIELISAIEKIKRDDFVLLVIGSYFYDTKVKDEFSHNLGNLIENNENKIIFTGYVPYEQISCYYKIADFAVLPSIWDDPAPLTIIESLQCGLPIITTNSGGIPEYVSKESAIILQRDEKIIENLKNSIEYLLNDSKKRDVMSEAALDISKNWSCKSYYYDFINLIGDIDE